MAYFAQPVITNVGRSNLLAQGLTITRVAFGTRYNTATTVVTRLVQESFSVSNPVLLREAQHLVISCMVDNQILNLTTSRLIKEIGVFARVGSGSEFLLAYTSYSAGDSIPSKTEANYQREWQLWLGLTNANISSVNYTSTVSGYAGANVVNALSQRLTTHENDNTKHVTPAERQRWDNSDLLVSDGFSGSADNLSTPGIYIYTPDKDIPGGYGFIKVTSNGKGSLGQQGNWTFHTAYITLGGIHHRRRINTDPWSPWVEK